MKNGKSHGMRIEATGGQVTLWVYSEIGRDIGQVSAQDIQRELDMFADLADTITIRINSPGGDVAEALAIVNILSKLKAAVRCEIDGWALSAASLVAMVGKPVVMAATSLMMVHLPWTQRTGDAGELRKQADVLDTMTEQMLKVYRAKTGRSDEELLALLTAETWMTADEALALGFCDEVSDALESQLPIAASLNSSIEIPNRIKEFMMNIKTDPGAAPHADPVKVFRAAEASRRSEIKAMFSPHLGQHRDLADECLEDMDCTADKASRKLLAALGANTVPIGIGRVTGGGHTNGDRVAEFKAAATDALLARNGIRVKDPSPAAQDLRNTSIVDMARCCLSMAGAPDPGANPNKVLAAAFGHSTSDFPALLSGVAQKSLMKGFDDEPASHAAWVNVVEVADFKEIQRVQRSDAPGLLHVPEGGEYKEGTFGEKRESYLVQTYGRLFTISRQALINDDLGAFTTLPLAFGASARRLEADFVYALLTANAAMSDGIALFHADHDNLSGASETISFTTLGAARAAMRRQRGVNGAVLNIVPRYLIVPATLESTAEVTLASLSRPDQENPNVPNSEFVKNLELVVDPRLDDHSTTSWYLAGSTAQTDTVELAYLEGQRGVYFEERDGWEIDGLSVKSRLDFGTKAIDWRGLYKSGV